MNVFNISCTPGSHTIFFQVKVIPAQYYDLDCTEVKAGLSRGLWVTFEVYSQGDMLDNVVAPGVGEVCW